MIAALLESLIHPRRTDHVPTHAQDPGSRDVQPHLVRLLRALGEAHYQRRMLRALLSAVVERVTGRPDGGIALATPTSPRTGKKR